MRRNPRRRHRCGAAAAVESLEQRALLSATSTEELVPGGVILNQDGPPLPIDFSAHAPDPGGGLNVGSFDIVLKKGPNLQANPAASAAFDQAATFLELIFSDPITVVIDAEIAHLGASILGQ